MIIFDPRLTSCDHDAQLNTPVLPLVPFPLEGEIMKWPTLAGKPVPVLLRGLAKQLLPAVVALLLAAGLLSPQCATELQAVVALSGL